MPQFACDHFIAGVRRPGVGPTLPVIDPASGEVLAHLPTATAPELDAAVSGAQSAFAVWSRTPVLERARVLFRFKELLERERESLARLVVRDNGKTLDEARGSVQRGIEVVEFATGMPSHLRGELLEEAASGIDVELFRQPLGVVAGLTPFNFPVMVPLWMIPIAVGCGNCFILKPSERAPLASLRLAELFAECGAPPGTLSVLHGTAAAAEALIAHPGVSAVSVVGSSPVARHVYGLAASHGKRAQALGGAKNALVVAPDADLGLTVPSIIASAFGCAGQRCLAGSNLIAIGTAAEPLLKRLHEAADALRLGSGLDPETGMGPVITDEARARICRRIEEGLANGAVPVRDGRRDSAAALPDGYFVGPTLLDRVDAASALAREEVFGPVLSVVRVKDLSEALEVLNSSSFGNSASLYTTDGGTARRFRREAEAGMLGINLGVPAPLPCFPFSGWKGSFFGDLHAQGRDAIDFYTRRKVVTSRW
jgi:malonate-semialdehyde dehydrogenase (acetylating)/methylmalonate-semialdehyde dehydrogenase